MPRRDPRSTVTGRCLAFGLGPKRTTAVLTYVALWSMFRAAEGRDPEDVDELARDVARDRATIFRWQADFRAVFAEEGWQYPSDLLDAAKVQKPLTVRRVGELRVA